MNGQLAIGAESPDVQELFDHWTTVMRKRKPLLGPARRSRITWALRNYGLDACRAAVDGCQLDRYAMGHNRTKRKHNDILDIFRDEKSIEDHIERAEDIGEEEDW